MTEQQIVERTIRRLINRHEQQKKKDLLFNNTKGYLFHSTSITILRDFGIRTALNSEWDHPPSNDHPDQTNLFDPFHPDSSK